MKQFVIRLYRLQAITLTNQQLRRLVDEDTIFGDSPRILIKPERQTLEDNLKFTFKMFGMMPGMAPVPIDTSSAGWQSFRKAVTIRNNLMHPKSEGNLALSEEEYIQVMLGWDWYTITATQVRSARLDQ